MPALNMFTALRAMQLFAPDAHGHGRLNDATPVSSSLAFISRAARSALRAAVAGRLVLPCRMERVRARRHVHASMGREPLETRHPAPRRDSS
eukprot:15433022-Alexandrium_andersonii.AAC.1